MRLIQNYKSELSAALACRKQLAVPSIRGPFFAAASLLFLVVLGAVWFAPDGDRARYFGEEGIVTFLSASLMALASGMAGAAFFLSCKRPRGMAIFWLLSALGFGFFSIDELLRFHERVGITLKETVGDPPEIFRNWNDIIVIGYGVVAMVVSAAFLPEILRLPRFAGLVALAAGCYVLHTGIDSVFTESHRSVVCEESSKLFSGGFFALSFFAALGGVRSMNARAE